MKIAIDAGHGSQTAGKRTPDGYREHWINVKTAYYLNEALVRCGFETYKVAWNDQNAKDDEDVPLGTRQKLIKAAGCDASISCHANAYGDGISYNSGEGVETLYHSSDGAIKDSERLANCIQSHLIEGTQQKNRGVKRMDLAMCNASIMGTQASVLIEIGFMTNKREADLMEQEAFCKEQAEEIAHGVCDYFGVEYKKEVALMNGMSEAEKRFFVEVFLYIGLLDREGDPAGIEHWVSLINDDTKVIDLLNRVAKQSEYQTRTITVAYQRLLGRDPDKAGLDHWKSEMAKGKTAVDIYAAIKGSEEYKKKHPTIVDKNNHLGDITK